MLDGVTCYMGTASPVPDLVMVFRLNGKTKVVTPSD